MKIELTIQQVILLWSLLINTRKDGDKDLEELKTIMREAYYQATKKE